MELCAAQKPALRINYVKHHIDKSAESLLCSKSEEKCETTDCQGVQEDIYKRRHDKEHCEVVRKMV